MLPSKPPSLIDHAIFQALPYPVYIVDRDFNVRRTNPSAEALHCTPGIAPSLPEELRSQFNDLVLHQRDLVNDDIRRAVHLSDEQAYLPQIFRLANGSGQPDGWAVMLVKITRLHRVIGAKAKTLSTLSHELKTPLTSIRMSLHLLLEKKLGALNADQREMVELGRNECEHMLAKLHALLELARWENGTTKLELLATLPCDLLAETGAAHRVAVQQAGNELSIEAPEDHLPSVMADLSQAIRVLGTLLSYAAKYGTKGGAIALRAKLHHDGFVRLSIISPGKTFNEWEPVRLFDEFSRRVKNDPIERGVDLALCQELAYLHGGNLGLLSPAEADYVEYFFDLRRAN